MSALKPIRWCLSIFFPLVMLFLQTLNAQNGQWLGIPKPADMGSGKNLLVCGQSCAIFATENTKYLLIYNAYLGEWLTITLNPWWHINYINAVGDLFFGYSDHMIFAYEASKNHLDTLRFEGAPFIKTSIQRNCSYGNSSRLAFFMSNLNKWYIYDTDLSQWQIHDFNIPDLTGSGSFFVDDESISMCLYTHGQPVNLVYNRLTKTIRQLDKGVFISKKFNGGFAGHYYEEYEYTLAGYSVRQDRFATIEYTCLPQNEYGIIFSTNELKSDSNYTFAAAFRRLEDDIVKVRFYGFSLLNGLWSEYEHTFPIANETYAEIGRNLAQYAWDTGGYKDGDQYHHELFIYSAKTGLFSLIKTQLNYYNVNTLFSFGPSVLAVADEKELLGINPCNLNMASMNLDYSRTADPGQGENYIVLWNYDPGTTASRIIIYNRLSNKFTSLEFSEIQHINYLAEPFLYIAHIQPQNMILFYDGHNDQLFQRSFSVGDYINIDQKDILAIASAPQRSFLFNVKNQSLYENSFEIKPLGLGRKACVAYHASEQKLYGYSAVHDQWSSLDLSKEAYLVKCDYDIGLISVNKNNNYYGKFYAFNSYSNSFVELNPEGVYVWHAAGPAILLLQQSTHIYAFDPKIPLNLDVMDNPALPGLYLFPNYPNPFNQQTIISFYLEQPGPAQLSIYNVLGQKIKVLADDRFSAGHHKITWKASDLPSGIYFYRLDSAGKTMTGKCLLVK